MQTLSEIRSLLASRGRRPRHVLGQNFLHDQNMIRKVIAEAAITPGELILEVGPGTGALTEPLLEAGARVVACEIDREMIAILESRVRPIAPDRLTIVQGDCLEGKRSLAGGLIAALGDENFKLVANLPYGAATPLIATLLERHERCRGQVVTVQLELANRLTAEPRSEEYGPISVMVQLLAEVRTITEMPPGCFWPAPKVTSAMISITPRPDRPEIPSGERLEAFSAFVGRVFGKRRKQLGSILGRGTALPPGIRPEQRPEELSPAQWLALFALQA